MSWIDRISGRRSALPETPMVTGQWRYEHGDPVRVRGARMGVGEVLLADAEGRFQSPDLVGLHLDPRGVPDEDALRCLETMGQDIQKRAMGHEWLNWLDIAPLMPPLDGTLDETELEQVIRAKIGHLEAACRRPKTHLRLEEERQLVARCRRPSPKAPMVLAAHSEDWDRRTLWGIRPKRVLGLVREDLYDLYENRLVVALVDRLDEALTQRIRAVRRVVQAARSREDWNKRLEESQNYRRAKRVCELWGDLWDDEGILSRAERVLRKLLLLRRKLLALKDSVLYKRIGGRKRTIHLRMTNVLTHDDIYRGVAELWKAWERHILQGREEPQAKWLREQEAASSFSSFGVLCVIRALDTLGMEPDEDSEEQPLAPGATLRLTGPCGALLLAWRADLSLEVRHALAPPLRVIAVPGAVEAIPNPGPWLNSLPEENLLVLHLSADQPRSDREARVRLNGPGPQHALPMLAPIAPWDLESVERIARALRWYAWSALFKAYPPSVPLPPSPWRLPANLPGELRKENREIQIKAPPRDGLSWPELDARIRRLEDKVQNVERRLSALDSKKRRDRMHLQKERQDHQDALDADRRLQTSLLEAIDLFESLRSCPVCHDQKSVYAFKEANKRFRVRCDDCRTTWGIRDCRSCDSVFPYLDNAYNSPGADALQVDRRYGSELIAFPADRDVYLCTCCGQRSDGATNGAA